jgi:hypothetical protein
MAYTFDPISSYAADGKRDIQVDCTDILEPLELVSSATATSLDTTILTISTAAAVNTTVLTKDDGVSTIAIGKGVTFGITTARKTTADVKITLKITGSSNTVETVTIIQPVVETITS